MAKSKSKTLPAQGGTWIRDSSGELRRPGGASKAPPKSSAKAARKTPPAPRPAPAPAEGGPTD